MTPGQVRNYNNFLANQNRLLKDLFREYDADVSAIYTLKTSEYVNETMEHPPSLELRLTLTMLKLVDVVEVEEKVTFLFDYMSEWTDRRLKWNPADYGGVSHIYVPSKKVWMPEVTIADAHEVKNWAEDSERNAWINANGTVGVYRSTVSSVICSLDVYRFPLDKHECGVSVLFHTYLPGEYYITSLKEDFPKPLSELGNGEWDVNWIGLVTQNSTISFLSAVVSLIMISYHFGIFQQKFEARFSRNPGFYVALVMVPAYFINFLSIIALFVDIENYGEKITIGLTNIMSMTFILVILAADLPKTKRIPLLGITDIMIIDKIVITAIYVIIGLILVMVSIAVVFLLPTIKKMVQKKRMKGNNEKKVETSFIFLSIQYDMTPGQVESYNNFLENQNRLLKDLFKNYDADVSAIYTLKLSKFINVSMEHPPSFELRLTLTMLKLIDVVETEEKVTFLFDYEAEWTDRRLTWNPYDYGGISQIYVPSKKVWMPEVTIADAHEVKTWAEDSEKNAWINFNGTVGIYKSTVSAVICSLDVFRFPMDEHKCGVSVMYHTYLTEEYHIKSVEVDFMKSVENYHLGNGEWDVHWIGVVEQISKDNTTNVQKFEAHFSRNPGFYISLVIIPAYFINMLSIFAIFIDIDKFSEKITIGLTNIMSMTFILVILSEDLPKTKRIPLLAIYVIIGLVIVMGAIGVVFVLPDIKKMVQKRRNNEEKKAVTRFEKLKKMLKLEHFLMLIFQIANFINFIVIFT